MPPYTEILQCWLKDVRLALKLQEEEEASDFGDKQTSESPFWRDCNKISADYTAFT
jgi:hypothetical protein